MENSTVNFTTTETSQDSTAQSVGPLDIMEICMLIISFLFGAPANICIIWTIGTGARSGLASEFFFLNLCVCETITCLNNLVTILPIFFSNLFYSPLFLQGLNMTGRPLFQSLICVERYLAVVHPVTFLKSKPLRYRLICCTVAWFITLVSCVYSLLIVVSQHNDLRVWTLTTQFLLFFSIQLFCLVAVLRALKQSGPGDRRREEENHMKRRAFEVILINTVSMTFMYVPYVMTGFSIILTQNNVHIFWVPSLVCFILGGFVQPVLYLHHTGKLPCPVTRKTYNCDMLSITLLSDCCFRKL